MLRKTTRLCYRDDQDDACKQCLDAAPQVHAVMTHACQSKGAEKTAGRSTADLGVSRVHRHCLLYLHNIIRQSKVFQ